MCRLSPKALAMVSIGVTNLCSSLVPYISNVLLSAYRREVNNIYCLKGALFDANTTPNAQFFAYICNLNVTPRVVEMQES